MNKIKLLILQNSIPEYRIPVYNHLSEDYDVTVTYTKKNASTSNDFFNSHHLITKKIGPFEVHKDLFSICKKYDVVVYEPNLHFIDFCLLPFLPHKYKTITHSIGFRASYTRKYDLYRKKTIADYLLKYIMLKSDAMLFYMKENIDFWNFSDKIKKRCFEARNTVQVKPVISNKNRNTILFVGSLYREKGVEILINAYKDAIASIGYDNFPHLIIIGDGPLRSHIETILIESSLTSFIHMEGAIYDESVLAKYFSNALVCVSPTQAGLSVPKSMGYGVPFVTVKNAVTGGEINHIADGENGILMNSVDNLKDILIDVHMHRDKYIKMGLVSKKYYDNCANIGIMVKGYKNAIEYVL